MDGPWAAAGGRFAIAVSRFNSDITEGLLEGALTVLGEAGISRETITVVRVPGAFELPLSALRLARSGRYDAVICLGCLIKGETMHFEYLAAAVSHGVMDASLATGVPIAFGVLTTLDEDQARARSAPGLENKGREAALAALEMARLCRDSGEASR